MPLSMRKRTKGDACERFLINLRELAEVDVDEPGFIEGVKQHFQSLPTRYALDVNTKGLEVLNHKRLLDEAHANPGSVAFQVRKVEVFLPNSRERCNTVEASPAGHDALSCGSPTWSQRAPSLRPAFASSPNLQALLLDSLEHDCSVDESLDVNDGESLLFYEITVAAQDQPKLLSKLSKVLGDAGLNIREAHVFNTYDKYSLDVFVVDGWQRDAQEGVEDFLKDQFQELVESSSEQRMLKLPSCIQQKDSLDEVIPSLKASQNVNDWEIDVSQLQVVAKIAGGSFSNLYKGQYYGQDVAVKIIKDEEERFCRYDEFMRELTIMRKVRHRNVVQFIGACTAKPNLCILFEYMSLGSVHDYLRKAGPLCLSEVLRIAIDICRGMDYLHKMGLIHRDLKTANLLCDENKMVKIADFGVARVVAENGDMTAETGTYRWMAPEVIEHKPYDQKADVFSFGVILWELLTGLIPYSELTPLQAAVGVVQKGLRPQIPQHCPLQLVSIMGACWRQTASERPSFSELLAQLQELRDMRLEVEVPQEERSPKKLLSRFRSR